MRCSTTKHIMARLTGWWNQIPDINRCADVPSFLHEASDQRLSMTDKCQLEVILRSFFWVVWCNRNDIFFRGKISNIASLAFQVKNNAYLWLKTRSKLGRNLALNNWTLVVLVLPRWLLLAFASVLMLLWCSKKKLIWNFNGIVFSTWFQNNHSTYTKVLTKNVNIYHFCA